MPRKKKIISELYKYFPCVRSANVVKDILGWNNINTTTSIITTARILLNNSPLISTAICAPINEPKKAAIPKYRLNG